MEHLNSTQITFGRYAQTNAEAYHRFQFVIAHEFYHLWNVKRIRPEILGPFDYSRPQHTRNLYVSARASGTARRSTTTCRRTSRSCRRSQATS